jgi:urease accessory protein
MTKFFFLRRLGFFVLAVLHTATASAHANGDAMHYFSAGFLHPWLGADHLMMVFAVGLLARSSSIRLHVLLPLWFWLAMAAGLYRPLLSAGMAEIGIATALVLIGFYLLLSRRNASIILLLVVVTGGYCHGNMHALEVVPDADATMVVIGLLVATATLHTLGMLTGRLAKRLPQIQTATGLACLLAVSAMA